MRALLLIGAVALAACSLEERGDYLIGRECEQDADCDSGQKCLPHSYAGDEPRDKRCRDRASFTGFGSNQEPPLAYCEASVFDCPEGMVCKADRVRPLDGGLRRTVCQPPESPFGPPP